MQDEIEDASRVSKTQIKKEMTALQKLGAALIDLPEGQLAQMVLAEDLLNAVLEARRIKSHGARKRQMLYVGRLMRRTDAATIRAQLEALSGGSAQSAAAHKRLEAWREKLLADDGALTDFASAFPGSDLQQLRTLIRNAKRERDAGKPPHAYRELFRLIKQCSDSNLS
jgi:ribosome-associated protein